MARVLKKLPKIQLNKSKTNQRKSKPNQIVLATIFGGIFTIPFLFALTGLYGMGAFAAGKIGDGSVIMPTLIYMTSILMGAFLATALVKRRTKKPALAIGGAYFLLSIIISLATFGFDQIKFSTIPVKLIISLLPAIGGFFLAYVPYLLHKEFKAQKKARAQKRNSNLTAE